MFLNRTLRTPNKELQISNESGNYPVAGSVTKIQHLMSQNHHPLFLHNISIADKVGEEHLIQELKCSFNRFAVPGSDFQP